MRTSTNARRVLSPELEGQLSRAINELGDEQEVEQFTICAADVLRAHFLIAESFRDFGEGIGGTGPRSTHLLQSAVSRHFVSYAGVRKWNDLYQISATLFFGLIKNHPFHDANKRTALLTALHQLECNGRVGSESQTEFEELTVRTAEGNLAKYAAYNRFRSADDADVLFIAWFFQRSTRKMDKREYRISFTQLDRILRGFGFRLGDAVANRIDVLGEREERFGVFGRKRRLVKERLATIGIRNWGQEVSGKDLREVRRATGLTVEQGYDSEVFFKGLDPLESLMAGY